MKIKSYYASTDILYENFDKYLAYLPEFLRERILKKSNTDAKVCSLGGALLLKYASDEFGADISKVVYSSSGKPYIPEADFHFSISHTKGYAAISFGRAPSGCDIQIEKNLNTKIAERFFCEKERDAVFNSADMQKEFFKIWCRKESLYKLNGKLSCSIENKGNYIFKDYKIKDNLCFCVCTSDCEIINPQRIDFDTVF